MTDKELIKQEIERRIGLLNKVCNNKECETTIAYKDILKFIDSLPEENHFEDKSEMVINETTIVNDWQYGKDPDYAVIPAIHQRIEWLNVGDKVKIIIVKEMKNEN